MSAGGGDASAAANLRGQRLGTTAAAASLEALASIAAAAPSPSSPFFELLLRLGQEYEKQVSELREEVRRLQPAGGGNLPASRLRTVSARRAEEGVMSLNSFQRMQAQGVTQKPNLLADLLPSSQQVGLETQGRGWADEKDHEKIVVSLDDPAGAEQAQPASSLCAQVSCQSAATQRWQNAWAAMANKILHKVMLGPTPQVHPIWVSRRRKGPPQLAHSPSGTVVAGQSTVDGEDNTGSIVTRLNISSKAVAVKAWCRPRNLLPSVPLHPASRTRMLWDIAGILLLTHDLIMIPMMAFTGGTEGFPDRYQQFSNAFEWVSAIFWTGDVAVSFLTGFHSTEGFVQLRARKIALHYLRSWFPIDMMIVLVDWITLFVGRSSASGVMRLGKTASRIMRVFRLLRLAKMNKSMTELLERINSEYILTFIGLVRLVVLIVFINHYLACFWYGISQTTPGDQPSWSVRFLIENGVEDLEMSYFTSLHWSLTQFTPASMEVYPQNLRERFFNIVVIIMALVIFSSFVSSITNAMTHIRNINAKQVKRDSEIRRYFTENSISHGLASRVWRFVRHSNAKTGRKLRAEELPFLQQLPKKLQDDLKVEVYGPTLMYHPMFQGCHKVAPSTFKKILKKITEMALASGQELRTIYDDRAAPKKQHHRCEVRRMLFVIFGTLEYHCDENEDHEAKVTPGQWALEAALWLQNPTIEGRFISAGGGCDLLLLSADVFVQVVKDNPALVVRLKWYAQLFMDRFGDEREALSQGEDGDVLLNDQDSVQDMASACLETPELDAGSSGLLEVLLKTAESHSDADNEDDGNCKSKGHPDGSRSQNASQMARRSGTRRSLANA